MSGAIQPRLPRFEPDIARLLRLPAWERAKVYDLANLGFGERSMIEAEVRAPRFAMEFPRKGGT